MKYFLLFFSFLIFLFLCGCGIRFELPGVRPSDEPKNPPCEGNACADIKLVHQSGEGYTLMNNGTKTITIKIAFGAPLGAYENPREITIPSKQQRGPYSYNSYKSPYKADYANNGAVVTPQPNAALVKSFEITPKKITAGQSVTFKIELDKPAPAGGTTVIFSGFSSSSSFSFETFPDFPYGLMTWTIQAGNREASNTYKTQKKFQGKPKVVFSAGAAGGVNEKNTEIEFE